MRAEIIAIGSELLTPYRLDTNSLLLTERLNRLGIEVCRKEVVGDDRESLDAAIAGALRAGPAEVLILMGGLGPTEDDRTRDAVGAALGRRQYLEENIANRLRARFKQRGMVMPEINLRQAMILEGAEILENPKGTAPGQWIAESGKYIMLLPGPPHELEAIFDKECMPRLEKIAPEHHLVTRVLKIAGQFESHVDQLAAPVYKQYDNPQTTILAAPGEIQLHLRGSGATEAQARALVNELAEKLKLALGDGVFSENNETMEEVLGRLLIMRGLTLAVAESCTGGLIGERLTRIAGSSKYFLGGIVSYSNQAKMDMLGVPQRVLETEGAVSAETARLMAEGVRRAFRADIGVSVTGIAGPTADGSSKPVGLVYAGLADDAGSRVSERKFPGDRERVRVQASQLALDMVRRRLTSLAL
jgi:nicotinamide-nucleotide amidase